MSDLTLHPGQRLETAIDKMNIKKGFFASKIGKDPSQLSRLIKGKDPLDNPVLLSRIKDEFAINPDWILNGKGEMQILDKNSTKDEDKKTSSKPTIGKIEHYAWKDDSEFHDFMMEAESLGRIIVFHTFPSSIFYRLKTNKQQERMQKICNENYLQKEFYTISGYLNFVFGNFRARLFSIMDKIDILDKMISTFSITKSTKEIILFDISNHPEDDLTPFGFGNLQLLPNGNRIVMQAPFNGVFMVYDNEELYTQLLNKYLNNIKYDCIKGKDSVKILRFAKESLENTSNSTNVLEQALSLFLAKVKEYDSTYIDLFKRNIFEPERYI